MFLYEVKFMFTKTGCSWSKAKYTPMCTFLFIYQVLSSNDRIMFECFAFEISGQIVVKHTSCVFYDDYKQPLI